MKRNLFIALTTLSCFLFACGGNVTKSKEYLALKAEMDKVKQQDSLEQANIAAYKKLNDDFMGGRKEDFLAGIADNYIDHNPDTGLTKKSGKEACADGYDIITGAFSEMSLTYTHLVAEGDMVFCHATMSGKNSGPMGPMPATNKYYKDVEFYEVVKYVDGKCSERWGLMDMNTMMFQLSMTGGGEDVTKIEE